MDPTWLLDQTFQNSNHNGDEAANVRIKSKLETEPGYKYQLSFKYARRSYSNSDAHKNLVVRFVRNKHIVVTLHYQNKCFLSSQLKKKLTRLAME